MEAVFGVALRISRTSIGIERRHAKLDVELPTKKLRLQSEIREGKDNIPSESQKEVAHHSGEVSRCRPE